MSDDTASPVWVVEWYACFLLSVSIPRRHERHDGGAYLDDFGNADPRERRIGEENEENIHQALMSLAIYPFTQRLGMSIDEVRALVAEARLDAANHALKAYFPLLVSCHLPY